MGRKTLLTHSLTPVKREHYEAGVTSLQFERVRFRVRVAQFWVDGCTIFWHWANIFLG